MLIIIEKKDAGSSAMRDKSLNLADGLMFQVSYVGV